MAEYAPWHRADTDALVELLTGEDWPYHAGGRPDAGTVRDRVRDGGFDGPGVRTFWVVEDGERAGFVRLFDLDDDTPMFDLRLRAAYRGRGLGTATVRWLTGYLFGELPGTTRIEATTRADNRPMRRVLAKAGYVREARYRQAWPVPGGPPQDSLGYAVLRAEWAVGAGSDAPLPCRPVLEPAALVVDCLDPGPVADFWAAATGGEVVRRDAGSARLELGGSTVIWRAVPGFRPPARPSPELPLQVHPEFRVDDLDTAERELLALGARPAPHSPPREDGLVVLLDPAGHPFRIGTRR